MSRQTSYTPAIDGYEKWLANGALFTDAAVARISELMAADARGRSDATGRFRPSMAGDSCPRRQMLSYRGVRSLPHDMPSMAFMTNGTWGHYRWQMAGLSQGFLTEVEVPLSNSRGVKGSGDGRLADDGSLFELKTTGRVVYDQLVKSLHAKTEHVMQVTWLLLESDIDWVSIVYEDRDMPQRRLELRVNVGDTDPTYPSIRRAAEKRLTLLHNHAEEGTLPAMLDDCRAMAGNEYRHCIWRKMCPKQV